MCLNNTWTGGQVFWGYEYHVTYDGNECGLIHNKQLGLTCPLNVPIKLKSEYESWSVPTVHTRFCTDISEFCTAIVHDYSLYNINLECP